MPMNEENDEILRKTRMHDLARQLVNETVAGNISLDTTDKIARLTLPPLKREWVWGQIDGITMMEDQEAANALQNKNTR